jgi:tRNA(Ile)-lysidine synthase
MALPRAASRRLLRQALGPAGFDHVETVLDLAARPQGHGRVELPGVTVRRSFDWLRIAPAGETLRPEAISLQVPGRYPWPGGAICIGFAESPSELGGCVRLKSRAGFDPAPLELRGWKAGDRYHRVGQCRDQKIKELFQKARVPSWRRWSWPIVISGPDILWAREFGAAALESPGSSEEPATILRIWEEKTAEAEPNRGCSASVSYRWENA